MFEKYAKNRERRAINQLIVAKVETGSSTPVTDAYRDSRAWNKNTFFSVARTLGYNVKKSAGLWMEVAKVK